MDFFRRKQPAKPKEPSLRVVCPYCMKLLQSDEPLAKCTNPTCGKDLPILYRTAAYGNPPVVPLFLQVAGLTQSGKTVFLYALSLMLRKMPKLWPGFFANAANDETRKMMRDVAQFEATGVLPPPTGLAGNEAYITMMQNMGVYPNRALVIRDVSGETFKEFEFDTDYAPYLVHVPSTLMFFDLNDMREKGHTMDELLNSYIVTLLENGVNPKAQPRNVVAIVSKADAISDLPPGLKTYVTDDPLWQDANASGTPSGGYFDAQRLSEYVQRQSNVSSAIAQWMITRSDANAAGFLAMAQQNNIGVRFSIISSLGGGVVDKQILSLSPRRVLDPFLWTLEFERHYAQKP